MLSYLNRIKNPISIFIINIFKRIQYYYSIFTMNNQESYQLMIQMQNLTRMINNLSNRLNNIEDIVRNTRDTQVNTIPRANIPPSRNLPVTPNQTQFFETSVNNPLFTYLNPEPSTPPPTPINPLFPSNRNHLNQSYNHNVTDTTNLRRRPIQRPSHTRTNTTNLSNNRSSQFQNLPTLQQPHVTRSYNSDGSLDTVEMTFTNVIDPSDLNAMFPQLQANTPTLLPTRRTRNPTLINSPDDARVFLNMLNALSTSPTRQNETQLSVQEINRHTTISSYALTTLPREDENDEEGNAPIPDICAICRASFEEGDVIRTLNNCNHYFHCNCIDSWIELRNSCPSCRHIINQPGTIENNTSTTSNTNLENTAQTVNGLD